MAQGEAYRGVMKWVRSKGVKKGDPASIWEQERQKKAKKVG